MSAVVLIVGFVELTIGEKTMDAPRDDALGGDGRVGCQDGLRHLRPGEYLAAEFDPRLAEVWLSVFTCTSDEQRQQQLGWFLRMAYLKGYEDALTEPDRGSLFRKFGVSIPARKTVRSGKRRIKR